VYACVCVYRDKYRVSGRGRNPRVPPSSVLISVWLKQEAVTGFFNCFLCTYTMYYKYRKFSTFCVQKQLQLLTPRLLKRKQKRTKEELIYIAPVSPITHI
jgi:hypothetical protein